MLITIILVVLAIAVVFFVIKNKKAQKAKEAAQKAKEEEEANKRLMAECIENLYTKWAICISKYGCEHSCLIHILEAGGEKAALRVTRNSKDIEELFKIYIEKETSDNGRQWANYNENHLAPHTGMLIGRLDKESLEKHPNYKCEITIYKGDSYQFYIVLDFVDFEEGLKIINA